MSEVSTYATGKRKTAVARVWISPGSGKMIVNGTDADHYFERETSRMIARQSLEIIAMLATYDVKATVAGGGPSSPAAAMRPGVDWLRRRVVRGRVLLVGAPAPGVVARVAAGRLANLDRPDAGVFTCHAGRARRRGAGRSV